MDVVAHGGTVRSRVVVAENGDLVQPAHRGEDCPRDEVRLGVVVLADFAVRVAAAGVEVSEAHRAQAVGRFVVRQRVFDGELRASVGIDWSERGFLGDRHVPRLAVDRTGREEHDRHVTRGTSRVEQVQRADDVVGVVPGGILERFPDVGARGEMQHDCGAVCRECPGESVRVEKVALDEWPPANETVVAGGEIVVHHRQEPAGCEGLAGMTADVSGAAGDERDWLRAQGYSCPTDRGSDTVRRRNP